MSVLKDVCVFCGLFICSKYYQEYGIVRDEELFNILVMLLETISTIQFRLTLKPVDKSLKIDIDNPDFWEQFQIPYERKRKKKDNEGKRTIMIVLSQ
jgi:hypothetical protein